MVNVDMSVPIFVARETKRSSVARHRALERSLMSSFVIISVALVGIADVEETTECTVALEEFRAIIILDGILVTGSKARNEPFQFRSIIV